MTDLDLAAPDEPGRIVEESVSDALSSRYLAYALSTITARAVPDVRDGLKPVQRRILYAMRELRLNPTTGFKKCAKIVGEVMGNFHPHGDQAIYDALVRLAQDFAQRYPLVDGQGNFGNIDGDSPAAMRYTEARLTPAASLLMEDLTAGGIDFGPTYDGSNDEPLVMPAAFPNLLANGATGIAVGMATNIPPHNAFELITAARRLIAEPSASIDDILGIVQGPDFPTGGDVVESPQSLRETYATGRGSIRVRARWRVEPRERGMWSIVVEEIPYQVQKAKLIERLASLLEAKKLPLLDDVRDESAEDVRLVLEPKSRTVDPEQLMESVFRQSDLEIRFGMNLNVLDAQRTPRVMSLIEALRAFLDHRREGLLRRARRRLEVIADRLEILAGFLIAFLDIDTVIAIIRTEDDPRAALMARFSLSQRQADAILDLRLRALRKLEEIEIRGEDARLRAEAADLESVLADPAVQWARVDGELVEASAIFGPDTALGRRRTRFASAPAPTALMREALVAREPATVVLSRKGWIRAFKGRLDETEARTFKDGDGPAFQVACETVDPVLLFGSDGRFYTLKVDQLPGGRGGGEPVRLHVDLTEGAEAVGLCLYREGAKLLVATNTGRGFIVDHADAVGRTRAGRQVLVVEEGERAVLAAPVEGDHVAVVGDARKLLVFPIGQLPVMGRGKGVRLQRYAQGGLLDLVVFDATAGLAWTDASGRRIAVDTWRDCLGDRAGAGKPLPKGFSKSGRFSPRE